MKFTSIKKENTRYVQFYTTKEELEKEELKKMVEKYKSEKCNVAIFVSGKENYPDILERIVRNCSHQYLFPE